MFLSLTELETIIDPAGGGGAPPEAAPETPPAEGLPEAPAVEPTPAPFSLDTPDAQEAIRREANAIFEQRIGEIRSQQTPAQQQEPIDLADFLNPLNDGFGNNLGQFLSQRDQYLLTEVGKLLNPLLGDRDSANVEKGHQVMDEKITSGWNAATDGPLSDDIKTAIREMAPVHMEEMVAIYGEGRQAAERALEKSIARVKALTAGARGAGAAANAADLAAVANANGEPGTSGGGMNVPPVAKSPRDVLARHFAGPSNT